MVKGVAITSRGLRIKATSLSENHDNHFVRNKRQDRTHLPGQDLVMKKGSEINTPSLIHTYICREVQSASITTRPMLCIWWNITAELIGLEGAKEVCHRSRRRSYSVSFACSCLRHLPKSGGPKYRRRTADLSTSSTVSSKPLHRLFLSGSPFTVQKLFLASCSYDQCIRLSTFDPANNSATEGRVL